MDFLRNPVWYSIIAVMMLLNLNSCGLGHQGAVSGHFDGSRFFNEEPEHTFTDMVKWMWEMETVEWPEWIEDPQRPPPEENVGKGELCVTFINHATVLIQMDGVNILTDPIWSLRAGPVSWLGVKRVRAPGVKLKDLPGIDYILISHDHYDHLDLPTLKRIVQRHKPKILVGLGLKAYLASHGILDVKEMDWGQTNKSEGEGNTITFVPARHNSGRWPLMGNKTLWGGFVIDSPSGQVYFAGDTAFGEFIFTIEKHFKKIRLAIFPIGSYEKRWFMKSQHLNPDDAVKAHKMLNAHQSIGVHYATFAEHPEQAINAHENDLAEALKRYDVPSHQFRVLKFGEGITIDTLKPGH